MADGTKAGGDAPRTLFSLGRSGKRKGRTADASPLEDYPPQHADETVTDDEVSPLADIENTDIDAAHAELLDAEGVIDDDDMDAIDDLASAEDAVATTCPSCSEPLVSGAMFCGECGTRLNESEDAAPAAVLLDDEVPGEPLPPEADGTFEVAEPVTGSFDDELLDADDLADDDGAPLEEQAVFGAFIGAEDVADEPVTEDAAEADEIDDLEVVAEDGDEAVADDTDTDTEVVDDDADAEVVEDTADEVVATDAETEVAEDADAEVVAEADDAVEDAEDDDHEGAAVLAAAAVVAGEGAEAELADGDLIDADADADAVIAEAPETEVLVDGESADGELNADETSDEGAPVVPIAAGAAAAGASAGGSKKGVWIGVAAAAAAVVLIIGVVAMGSGGKGDAKKDDQVASGTKQSTTTTVNSSTTAPTSTTAAPSTTETTAPPTTDTTSAPASTASTAGPQTPVTPNQPVIPPPTVSQPANVSVECPGNLAPGRSYKIVLHNSGGATSFLVTWSALKTGVTVSPTTGSVPAGGQADVTVNVANGTPGSASRVTIKWSGGSTSCNLLVQ